MADNLRAGVRARLHSLKAATQYNDAEGHLLEWNDKKGRWDVRLNSGEVLSVRPANLGLPGGMAGNGTERWQAAEEKIKEWKDVQEGAMLEAKQFVDSLDPAPDEKQIVMSLLLSYSAADFDEAKRLKCQNAISAASGASAADVNVGQVTEMRPSTVRIDTTIKVPEEAAYESIAGRLNAQDAIDSELRQQGLSEMVRMQTELQKAILSCSELLARYKRNGWTPDDDQAWANDMLAAIKNSDRHEKVCWEIQIAHGAHDHRDVLKRADEGLAVAEELRNSRPEVASHIYRMIADSFSSCCDQVKSVELLEQSKTLAVEAAVRCPCKQCQEKVANVFHSLGGTRLNLCEHVKAIDDFEQAKKIHVELGDRDGEAAVLQNLGHCYLSLEQYEKAMEVLEQSLAMYEELSNKSEQAITLWFLGRCLSGHGQHDRTVSCLRRAWAISQDLKDDVKVMQPVRAGIAMSLGQARWAQARAGHCQCLSDAASAGGILTSDVDTLQDAEQWLKTSLELAQHEASNIAMDATVHLARVAFLMGNEDQAVDLLSGYLRWWTLEGPDHCAACMQGLKQEAPMLTCTGCGVARSVCSAKPWTCVRFPLRARRAVADSEAWAWMMQVLQRAATVDSVVWPNRGGGRWHSAQGHLPTPEAISAWHLPG